MRQPKDIIIGDNTLEEILIRHDRWINKQKYNKGEGPIERAILCGADLSCADLSCANLCGAVLHGADLRYVNFHGANLCGADLSCADLSYADLSCANLYYAYLTGAKGSFIEYRKGKILTQNIIGYKKCIGDHGDVIVTLEIPRGAIVFSINGCKFRTNKAKVIGLDGGDRAMSFYQYMTYYVGDEFTIYDFDCEYNNDCAAGIHFFMTREEAENYEI